MSVRGFPNQYSGIGIDRQSRGDPNHQPHGPKVTLQNKAIVTLSQARNFQPHRVR